MILNTKTIRTFISESSVVKPSVVHANLNDVIKIECKQNKIIFTKTNMNVFCTYTIEDTGFHIDDECYLISERTLNGLVQTTQSDTITIEQKENMLYIKGDKAEKLQCPAQDVAMFPDTPECTSQPIPLDMEALYCIKIAGNYINTDQKLTAASFVHIGPGGVFATNNNNIIYYRKFDGLPDIFFGTDVLQVIKPVNGVAYATHGNYDFINYEQFSFGVIKSAVTNPINYSQMIGINAVFNFEIELQKLLDYCTLVNYATKSEYPLVLLTYDGENIFLNHDDHDFNIHVNKEYKASNEIGEPMEGFKFCVKYLELFLKHLPYTNLTFALAGNHFKITTTEDENFIGIFAGQA
jgi:hypothetical protein